MPFLFLGISSFTSTKDIIPLFFFLFYCCLTFGEVDIFCRDWSMDAHGKSSLGSEILSSCYLVFILYLLICLQSLMFLKKWSRSLILDLWSLRWDLFELFFWFWFPFNLVVYTGSVCCSWEICEAWGVAIFLLLFWFLEQRWNSL